MSDRLPEHILNHIRDAIKSAGLENASFDRSSDERIYGKTATEFIRDKVKLHHDTWIIGPLKMVLNWSAGTDDIKSMAEHDLLGRLRAPLPNPAVLEEAHKEITRMRARVVELEEFRRAITAATEKLAARNG